MAGAGGPAVAAPDVAAPDVAAAEVTHGASTAPAQPAAVVPAGTPAVPGAEPGPAPVDELAVRRRAKRRIAMTTLSVVVTLGAGGAVAAASDQGFRESFTQFNQAVTSYITGSGAAPVDQQAQEPSPPLPAAPAGTSPAGTAPGRPASIPADPAAATLPTTASPSDSSAAEGSAIRQPTSPGRPGEVPASEALPGAVPGPTLDGLGGSPEVPVPSQVPLPATLPAVPLP
jgi:hypothetical protein